MAFDLRTHIRDPKTGRIIEKQPYVYRIGPNGARFIRGGAEFHPDGTLASEAKAETQVETKVEAKAEVTAIQAEHRMNVGANSQSKLAAELKTHQATRLTKE